ncbi:hypothetical protein GOEFS_059_00090 [Gordonia effusa NBRC 100432]|uniref:DUF5642 domain-containing protein n=1 Tax=Gordonia effusa NBRC 100432 TaxID=1077974 RepID=H0R0H4_9ACTN|nr:hypothetical protein [Gordonia effusa]GAB18575.1 hypothetical protein GOEFS_059_00090 [Gordonia effusa NBRC 100432]
MTIRFATVASTLAITLLAGCATAEKESAHEQPSSQPSSMQQYLLTSEDFPADTKFQHVNQEELRKATTSRSAADSDDPECAARLKIVNVPTTDIDGVNAVPRQGTLFTNLVLKPQYDRDAVARSVSDRCSKQTATTQGIPVEMTFEEVRTPIPNTFVLRQTVTKQADGTTISSTLVGYANRRDVTASLTMMVLPEAAASSATEADLAEFEKYFAKAVAKVEG